jgi:FkbM family methyltransferase
MLIDARLMKSYIDKLQIRGIFHIGANTCQELGLYNNVFGIPSHQIVWIEAIPSIVNIMKQRGIQNIYQTVFDRTPGEVSFNVTNNNGESSSILALKTHLIQHPHVKVSQILLLKTETFENFVSTHSLPTGCLDFLVMDIQGAELQVLSGSPNVLKDVKMICTEINSEELYAGAGLFSDLTAFLESHGFVCVSSVINNHKWGDALYVKKEYA